MTEVNAAAKNSEDKGLETKQDQPSYPPLWDEPEGIVRNRYELGEITEDDVRGYKINQTFRKGGLFELSEDQLRYAYERQMVTQDQVKNWKDYQEDGPAWDPKNSRGLYEMSLAAQGLKFSDIEGTESAADVAFGLDPIDIVVDIATGGFTALPKIAGKGVKEVAKIMGKEIGRDVVYGRIAAGAMDGIDAAGGGTVLQMLGAFTSPAIAQAMATGTRRTLIAYFKGIGKHNPEQLENITKVIHANPEDPTSQKLAAVLEEYSNRGIFQVDDVRKGKLKGPTPEDVGKSKKVLEGLVDGDEAAKVLDDQLGSEHLRGYTDKLMERIRTKGMSGVEIIDEINTVFAGKIANAKNFTSDAAAEAKVQNHIKKLSNNLGMSKVKTEKMLQFAHDAKMSIRDMNVKARVINEAMLSYAKQTDEFLDAKIFGVKDPEFADVLEAMEHIRVQAELQEAFFGIRGEFGRGMRTFRDDQMMKNRFDFQNIPKMDYDALKAGHEKDMVAALRHWKNGKTPKVRNRRARNLMKNRWLKGILELEQASLLSHWKTQVINIMGSTMAAGNEMAIRYASINWKAWKQAGDWKRPFSRDELAMHEWKLQKEAWKEALVDCFRMEGGWAGLVKEPRKTFFSEENGKFWRALITAEPQLDAAVKYDGQSLGAVPDYLKIGFMKLPLGKVIRLPFHGLTAGDEIFKGIGYRMEMNRQLYRKAIEAGADNPEAIAVKAASFLRDGVPPELHEAALKQSRYGTFTDDLGKGFIGKFEGAMNADAIGITGRILAMPFFRVVINLPKYALQQTPIGIAAKWQRDVIKKARMPNATIEDKQMLVELLARWSLGTTVLASGFALHQAGKITGGTPIDQRDIHKNHNIQAYSFVTPEENGDTGFIDYNRLDPYAFNFGIGAALSDAFDRAKWYNKDIENYGVSEDDLAEVCFAFLTAFTSPLMEKTVAKSLKDTIDAVTTLATGDGRMKLDKYGRRQLEKFYPRALDIINDMRDADGGVLKESRDVIEGIMKRWVPEKATDMRHEIYGDVVHRVDRVAGVFNKRISKKDPVLDMLLKSGSNVGAASYKGRDKFGQPWEFTPAQQTEFLRRISESGMKEHLQEKVKAIQESGMTDDYLIGDMLKSAISDWRGIVRDQMLYFDDQPILTREDIEKRMELKASAAIGEVHLQHKTARRYNWLK